MIINIEWSKETYDRSISSECWWFTPYDKVDLSYWKAVSQDSEMRSILAMEYELGKAPDWTRSVGIDYLPPCGHCTFPKPLFQVLSLIGSADPAVIEQTCKYQCYVIDRERKRVAHDYCLCLDAWLAGVDSSVPVTELNALSLRKIDWFAVCSDIWEILGNRSEKKELQVELVLNAIRHAIKVSRCPDDEETDFVDNGGYSGSPRAKEIMARLKVLDPKWEWVKMSGVDCDKWWLCAPKAFRFLEYDLWTIAHGRPVRKEEIPGFLRCEDTYPNQDEAATWYRQFCNALDAWWKNQKPTGPAGEQVSRSLGESSPVKRWLVRLFLKKLKMYESTSGIFKSLINPGPHRKRGTKRIELD